MPAYSVKLSSLVEEFSLEPIYLPHPAEEIRITRPDTNRPALALSGVFNLFEPDRIQLIGNAEHEFLSAMPAQVRRKRTFGFMAQMPVAVIFTNTLEVFTEFKEAAAIYSVPILRTVNTTSYFTAALIGSLSLSLAPRITRHGVLVEVYGEGILITGESGIGKSETAIELVKRGHRLIADDAVDIRKVSARSLVGRAPEAIRHYAELRGVGVIDVRRIFGIGAVKESEKIDLVITLEQWDQNKFYDRMGLESEYCEIMGLKIPMVTIPVRPGRNLAIIIEIAAMNNRQKRMGYNTAEEFNKQMLRQAGVDPDNY
ncbi:MAG: HPr(Ser) kinase/phosphatase [Clostridia bacterium]|nr:HPr(Ser) kinase/phosphatase [Clostridia bacterium]